MARRVIEYLEYSIKLMWHQGAKRMLNYFSASFYNQADVESIHKIIVANPNLIIGKTLEVCYQKFLKSSVLPATYQNLNPIVFETAYKAITEFYGEESVQNAITEMKGQFWKDLSTFVIGNSLYAMFAWYFKKAPSDLKYPQTNENFVQEVKECTDKVPDEQEGVDIHAEFRKCVNIINAKNNNAKNEDSGEYKLYHPSVTFDVTIWEAFTVTTLYLLRAQKPYNGVVFKAALVGFMLGGIQSVLYLNGFSGEKNYAYLSFSGAVTSLQVANAANGGLPSEIKVMFEKGLTGVLVGSFLASIFSHFTAETKVQGAHNSAEPYVNHIGEVKDAIIGENTEESLEAMS